MTKYLISFSMTVLTPQLLLSLSSTVFVSKMVYFHVSNIINENKHGLLKSMSIATNLLLKTQFISDPLSTTHKSTTLQRDLLEIQRYCNVNPLLLNISHCNIVSYSLKQNGNISKYDYDGIYIPKLTTLRDFGVTFDVQPFKGHVQILANSCSKFWDLCCAASRIILIYKIDIQIQFLKYLAYREVGVYLGLGSQISQLSSKHIFV